MRISREKKTIAKMIEVYCKKNHGVCDDIQCSSCPELLAYAYKKIDLCRFGEKKPVCSKCKVHCYNDVMRNKVRAVMRYSGPRMIFMHPILAILHMIDSGKNRTQ